RERGSTPLESLLNSPLPGRAARLTKLTIKRMPQSAKNATIKSIKWTAESKAVRRNKSRRVSKSRRSSADPTEGLQVGNPNAAAIDIGCSEHWVAVPAGRTARPTQ